ncbi:glycosyltransferase family 2 protein [Aliarcobacter cryaerophilus]|uniref:glycosyltransferase family 2 protein n=1 Tax=Aliarcobacter cryaerophilus TaxID=28198 RepID=UPI003DA31730
MDKKINISIVIPSLNGENHLRDFLIKNLEIIKATLENEKAYNKIELIVINDNSSDNSLEYLKECQRDYDFLIFATNPKQGAGSARNQGVSISSLSSSNQNSLNYILFIDNDVLLDETFFTNTIKYLQTEPFCITCNGISYFTKQKQDGVKLLTFKRGFFRFTKNIYKNELANIENELNIASFGAQGAYFFLKYEDFMELGGYDEFMDPYLLEESDLVYRGLKRGKSCIYAPDVTGYHKVGGTIASKVSTRTKILSKRNRNYFVWKNLHNSSLLLNHYLFLFLSIFSIIGFRGFIASLKMYKKAKELNKKERAFIKLDDLEILEASRKFEQKHKKS